MPRVRRSVTARKRHKKVLKAAKGYRGARSRTFKVAQQAVTRAGQYAYRDRRQRKRQFRNLWIIRINAAAREHGLSYSRFMHGLAKAKVMLDRRVLANIAVYDKAAFGVLVAQARQGLGEQGRQEIGEQARQELGEQASQEVGEQGSVSPLDEVG